MNLLLVKRINSNKEKKNKNIKESWKESKLKMKMQDFFKWPNIHELEIMILDIILILVKSQNNKEEEIVKILKKQF